MRVAQVTNPHGPIEVLDRPIPDPGAGKVRVKVEACGICHSDSITKESLFPGIAYPRIPGHEVTGTVDALGEGVTNWTKGQRVGIGWAGGHCTICYPCRRGDFAACLTLQIPGIVYDGGYAEYMITSAQGLAAIPDAISFTEAAPLLCAGITTFNALRHSGAMPGHLVAIQGLGGLGHLGIQYANKMGFETVAIGRGDDKKDFASKLGAHHYIDTNAGNPAEALQKLGGAKTILATAPDSKSMTPLIAGLSVDGTLMVIGVGPDNIEVSPTEIVLARRSVRGWPSGTAADSEDAMRLAALSGIRPMIETFPLKEAAAAYDRMMSGKARFRVVLKMN
ncbi:MAG TPA: alcohol dehydrogenase [Bryobacteraceae bacterium]|jgi:D-arabinose 1-dehydrogenase-like Zn-dependent alcohol dehydrogenase|nr:alcohol dehydrogenase [Bryobacteraceae bacterium]